MRFVRRLVEAVEQAGVPRSALLRGAGIDAALLEDLEARVPRSQLHRIFELALDLTGDPALGLHWSEGLNASGFAPVTHLLAHAANMREAFALLSSVERLLTDRSCFQLIEQGDKATVHCPSAAGTPLRIQRFAAEMRVTAFFLMIRFFSGHGRPERVCFEYAAPPYRDEYTRIFGRAESFEQPFTGLVFPRAMLEIPSPYKDDEMRDSLRAIAERRIMRLTQHGSYAQRLRELLLQRGASRRIDMQTAARSLGLSVRSLRRRLAAEGRSYRAIETDALAIAAKQLIRDQRRTIQEAAEEMGFSDTTTFHRAFKRWTGMTPMACREES
jgi:AraC-like DNA-binding protein